MSPTLKIPASARYADNRQWKASGYSCSSPTLEFSPAGAGESPAGGGLARHKAERKAKHKAFTFIGLQSARPVECNKSLDLLRGEMGEHGEKRAQHGECVKFDTVRARQRDYSATIVWHQTCS